MMMISIRQKEIIECFFYNNGIMIKDLAKTLDITERTIYRDLLRLNNMLKEYNISLKTNVNKGVEIVGKQKDIIRLKKNLGDTTEDKIYPIEIRKTIILLKLLDENSYIKAQTLAIDTKSSLKTIRNDLIKIKTNIEKYQINIKSKKGSGFFIGADEVFKRHLFVKLIFDNITVDHFFEYLFGKVNNPNIIVEYFLSELGYNKYLSITYEILCAAISKYHIKISDRNFQEFLLLLTILVKQNNLSESKYSFNRDFTVGSNKQKLPIELKDEIEKRFDCNLKKLELEYLFWISNLYIEGSDSNVIVYSDKFSDKIKLLIKKVEVIFNTRLYTPALEKSLSKHLSVALNRIKKAIWINNPYTEDIKKNYEEIFIATHNAFNQIFPKVKIYDDEIAYITLYFVTAFNEINSNRFKALVVCTSGMGTSKLLVSRLKKEFSDIVVKQTLPLIKLQEENVEEYVVIISTSPLDIKFKKAITVSPLLTDSEIKKLKLEAII